MKIMGTAIAMASMYIVQFEMLPEMLSSYYPSSNLATLMYILSTIIVMVVGIAMTETYNIIYWLTGDIAYVTLSAIEVGSDKSMVPVCGILITQVILSAILYVVDKRYMTEEDAERALEYKR